MAHGYPIISEIKQAFRELLTSRGSDMYLSDIYEKLADHFELSSEQRRATSVEITTRGEDRPYWENLVRTAKARLTEDGILVSGLGGGLCRLQQVEDDSTQSPPKKRVSNKILLALSNANTASRTTPTEHEQASDVHEALSFSEGKPVKALTERIERNPAARQECLRAYGTNCFVCDMDFESDYGHIGRGYIEVHHLKPLSLLHGEHRIDPVKDLRPLCPNCHSMIHRRTPPFTIEELKARYKGKKVSKR